MDLDGTLTQHKSPLEPACKQILETLAKHYTLLMVCAGSCERVYNQLKRFPVAIYGFYGMQYSEIQDGRFTILDNVQILPDREAVIKRGELLRKEFGFEKYAGDPMEFHASGLITFPILGTEASLDKKLAYDPNRAKRRKWYPRVREVFREYNVFIGGSSSFDIVPKPYHKLYALQKYLKEKKLLRENVVFFGDDYGAGGNDREIYVSGIPFVKVDHYKAFPEMAKRLLLDGCLSNDRRGL